MVSDKQLAPVDSAPRAAPRMTLHRRIKHARRAVGKKLVDWLGRAALSLLSRTWRTIPLDAENLAAARGPGGGHFIALWHGRMVLGLQSHAHRSWRVLVSPSPDGEISQSLLKSFGYVPIRGSSSRGGARALREMVETLRGGMVVIVTPDGPRGPRHSMNSGLAWMARATGHAILPMGFACDRGWRMRSWDRFTIPKPWARVAMVYGTPIRVARGATPEDLERATEEIRARLMAAEQKAFAHLAQEPDW
jgi:lysophospholipid acyltransferase (LPLAT)-like uncharacterized protein